MKNPNDFNEGWTTKITNPQTGKGCSGGAARNLRIAQQGGAAAVQAAGAMAAIQCVQPVIERLEKALHDSNKLNLRLAKMLTTQANTRRV